MFVLLYAVIVSLYLIVTSLGVSKLRSSLNNSKYFVYFLVISTVVQIYQVVNSYNSISTFYLDHFFYYSLILVIIQYEKWNERSDYFSISLIICVGYTLDSLITPINETPITGLMLIDFTIAYLSAKELYQYILDKAVMRTKDDFRSLIYLAFGGYYSYEVLSMLSLRVDELVIPWLLNVVVLGAQLIAFIIAIYKAGDKR
jgi:hypothetical protein